MILTELFSVPLSSPTLATNEKLGYVPALDGLRALAILVVIVFHIDSQLLPGGRYGVDLFFVLSGFLITTLLLQEWTATGSISLRAFYGRRILRLMPAALFFFLIYVALNANRGDGSFNSSYPFDLVIRNAVTACIYVFNWVPALGGAYGAGFLHVWSLPVEEQFYLLWPVALVMMLTARAPPTAIFGVTCSVLIASASIPFLLDGDWGRFYYGTDFRIQAPLAGSLLAQLYVAGLLRSDRIRGIRFQGLVWLSFSAFIASLFLIEDSSYFLFHGGHTVYAAAAALLVLGCAFRETQGLPAVLSHPVFTYIGRRSYALYLWHVLWADWFRHSPEPIHFALVFILSFAAAELSYRIIESPALRLKARLGRRPSADSQLATTPVAEPDPRAAA